MTFRMFQRVTTVGTCTLLLVSCGPVGEYKKLGESSGLIPGSGTAVGYEDARLPDDVWLVSYSGGYGDTRQSVTEYFHRRSDEVCQENGHSSYTVLEQDNYQRGAGLSYYPAITGHIACGDGDDVFASGSGGATQGADSLRDLPSSSVQDSGGLSGGDVALGLLGGMAAAAGIGAATGNLDAAALDSMSSAMAGITSSLAAAEAARASGDIPATGSDPLVDSEGSVTAGLPPESGYGSSGFPSVGDGGSAAGGSGSRLGAGTGSGNCEARVARLNDWIQQQHARIENAGICNTARISEQLSTRAAKVYGECPIMDPDGTNLRAARDAIEQSRRVAAQSCTTISSEGLPPAQALPPLPPVRQAPTRPTYDTLPPGIATR